MNCTIAQRRISALDDPASLPASLQQHVDGCPACHDWQRRIVQIDNHVLHMPVPPSFAEATVLHRLQNQPLARPGMDRQKVLYWRLGIAGMAASLLIGILALQFFFKTDKGPGPTARQALPPANRDLLLDNLVKRNLSLAIADNSVQQVVALADLSKDLSSGARDLARKTDVAELKDFAMWYDQVLRVEKVCAAKLDASDRAKVLKQVIQELAWTAEDAEKLAHDMRVGSAGHPLMSIASSARRAKEDLEGLLGQARMRTTPAGQVVKRQVASTPAGAFASLSSSRALIAQAQAVCSLFPRLVLAAGGLPAAQASAPLPDEAERFGRNRNLIHALVNGSVLMAGTNDPLKRVECCQKVLEPLAEEMQQAIRSREAGRVDELASHLHLLMQRGAATNLALARGRIRSGSPREKELLQAHKDLIERVMVPLERQLSGSTDPRLQEVYRQSRKALSESRTEVDRALTHKIIKQD